MFILRQSTRLGGVHAAHTDHDVYYACACVSARDAGLWRPRSRTETAAAATVAAVAVIEMFYAS